MSLKTICTALSVTLGLSACATAHHEVEKTCTEQSFQVIQDQPQENVLADKALNVVDNVLNTSLDAEITEDSVTATAQLPCENGACTVHVEKSKDQSAVYVIFYNHDRENLPTSFIYLVDENCDGFIDHAESGVYYSRYLSEHDVPEIKKREVFDYYDGARLWSEEEFQELYEDALEELLWYYSPEESSENTLVHKSN